MNDRLPGTRAVIEEVAAREAPTVGEHTSNHIVRSILGYLQERSLQPGDRLPSERALADKLGVGRNALREALATLTTLRVVEARPNSGIYLRRVSTESSFETLAPGTVPVMVFRTSGPTRISFPSTGFVVAVSSEEMPPCLANSWAGSGALYSFGSAGTKPVVNGSFR